MIKHFPKENILHKLINKNNTKIAYSCTPNMGQIISGHNKKLIREHYNKIEKASNPNKVERTCNCQRRNPCPLDGKCLLKDVLYKGVCSGDGVADKTYIGLTATTFKERYANHKMSFNNVKYKNETTLSSYFWKLKSDNRNPSIKFSIIRYGNVMGSFAVEKYGLAGLTSLKKSDISKRIKQYEKMVTF